MASLLQQQGCPAACTAPQGGSWVAHAPPSRRRPARQQCAVAAASGAKHAAAEQVQLGASDLRVSRCCLGTMTWGMQNTEEEAHQQMDVAWDEYGLNFLDTAEICEQGRQGGCGGCGGCAPEGACLCPPPSPMFLVRYAICELAASHCRDLRGN